MNTLFERDVQFTGMRIRELRAIAADERRARAETEPRAVDNHPITPARWAPNAITLAAIATFVRRAT